MLCTVISRSVQSLSDNYTCLSSAVHTRWPERLVKLAPLLGVSADLLLRHYVLELYTSGLDRLAQQVTLDDTSPYLPTVRCVQRLKLVT